MAASSLSERNHLLVTRQFTANSFSGVVQFLTVSAVYILIYPFLLRSLGPQQFGLWAVLGVPSQYIVLGTFGLSNALIKLVAETPTEKESDRLGELAGSATTIFISVGSFVVIAVFLFQTRILEWLQVTSSLLPEARVLLLGMSLVIFGSLLASAYISFLTGMHRMDLANIVQAAGSVMNGVGMFAAIKLGTGLVGLMLAYALSTVITWLAALFLSQRICRMRWTAFPKVTTGACTSLIRFGLYVYVGGLASILLEPSLKVLLSHYWGLESVSNFEIASRVLIQFRSLFVNVMLPLLPASSLLMFNTDAIGRLFARAMQLLWLTAIPAFVALACLSLPILRIWLGRSLPLAAAAMTVLSVGWLINTLTVPSYLLVQGMNRPRDAMICSLSQGLVSIVGGLVFIPRFGIYGAAVSESVGLTVASVYIWGRYRQMCPARFEDILQNTKRRALGLPIGLALALFTCGFVLHVSSAWKTIALCLASATIYGSLLFSKHRNGFTAFSLLTSYLPSQTGTEGGKDSISEKDKASVVEST